MTTSKKFKVYVEGYLAPGSICKARYCGEFKAETFKDAVKAFRDSFTDKLHRDFFDINNLTYLGLKLFDNKEDARKLFG